MLDEKTTQQKAFHAITVDTIVQSEEDTEVCLYKNCTCSLESEVGLQRGGDWGHCHGDRVLRTEDPLLVWTNCLMAESVQSTLRTAQLLCTAQSLIDSLPPDSLFVMTHDSERP